MKTKEFRELAGEAARFLELMGAAQKVLREKGSYLAADALDRLAYKVTIELSETLREMQTLEARGA